MLCRRDYAERVVASFSNQIKSEYYVGNRSVSIEVIALEHFSALPQIELNTYTKPCLRCAVFHYFLSDDRKQDAANNTTHRNFFIEILKEQKLLMSTLSKIWENTYSCAEQYICASELYLMSFLYQCYSIIIY